MAGLATAVASGIGAGVSQGRIQTVGQQAHLKDQERSAYDVRTAALNLIQRALSVSGPTRHDLDLLA